MAKAQIALLSSYTGTGLEKEAIGKKKKDLIELLM